MTFSRQGKGRPQAEISSLNGDAEKLTPYKSNGGHNYRAGFRAVNIGARTLPCKPSPSAEIRVLVSDCLALFDAVSSITGNFGGITRYCINVDWFEATLEGNWLPHNEMGDPLPVISKLNGDLILERDPARWNGTKHYQYCYLVYLYGEPVATIITHPRNAIMGQRDADGGTRSLSQLRIENHLLYRSGWLGIYSAILRGLGVVLNNVTRVDISVDGGEFLSQYQRLVGGEYKKLGRASHACYFDSNDKVTGFYIGSRSSERYVRGYSKTGEIKQAGGHKSYILDSWKKAGLAAYDSGKGDVDRLEVVLKAKAIAQLDSFDIDRLEEDSYLAGIMRASLEKFYQFVRADELERTGNISRCARIAPVDWGYFDAEQLQRLPTTKKPNVIWAVQRRITFDMLEYYARKAARGEDLFSQDTLYSAGEAFAFNYELAKSYGVLDWFERKLPYWQKRQDFHYLMEQERQAAKLRNSRAYHLKPAAV